MTCDELITAIRERGCWVFGAGFVATMLREGLVRAGVLDRVMGYLASAPEPGQRFDGFEVKTAVDPAVDRDALVCIAVHESNLEGARCALRDTGFGNTVWVYPHIYELVYGKPLYRQVELPLRMILGRQDPTWHWLAVRALAVEGLLGERRREPASHPSALLGGAAHAASSPSGEVATHVLGGESSLGVYLMAQSLHCSEATARKRLGKLGELVASLQEHGFDAGRPVLVDTQLRIIDGLHRIAAAWVLGIERIPCDIVRASDAFDRLLTNANKMTEDELLKTGLNEGQLAAVKAATARMCAGGATSAPATSAPLN